MNKNIFFFYGEVNTSVADPGCLSLIPDPNFFHSAFEFFDPRSASKNISILTQKFVSKLSEISSGLFTPDLDPYFLPIPDPGSRGQKGTWSRIRNTGKYLCRNGLNCCISVYVEFTAVVRRQKEILKKLVERKQAEIRKVHPGLTCFRWEAIKSGSGPIRNWCRIRKCPLCLVLVRWLLIPFLSETSGKYCRLILVPRDVFLVSM